MFIDSSKILIEPNEILRKKSVDVTLPLSDQDKELLSDMLQYVRNSRDEEFCEKYKCKASVGIAAPQVGVNKKMLAVSIEDEDETIEFVLANVKLVSNSTQMCCLENGESCLSVTPDVEGIVKRYYKIKVKAYNLLTDREEIISLKGYPAIVMQHEMDHLYGILYFDHINKANPWYIDPKVIKI